MPKSAVQARYLDPAGAAIYLGRTEGWVKRASRSGRLPHIKLSDTPQGRIAFDPVKLDEWMASRAVEPTV